MNEDKCHLQKDNPNSGPANGLDRRDFLHGVAAVPVLGLFGYAVHKERVFQRAQTAAKLGATAPAGNLPELNVALIGAGAQGSVLLDAMLKIPNIRLRAVCDIWTDYSLKRTINLLSKYKFEANGYEDYREMLEKEKGLDAVVIATPDFWHSRQTVDCLRAGLHVYCEKEMSNTLEGARHMVLAARETGKLLQIGHQRRSHPRYLHCYEKLLKANMIGRIVTINGQWNRSVQQDLGWPNRYLISQDRLEKYGFKSMQQFRNWRWCKGLGGGPIVDLGSHQIDIYNWFLDAKPKAVMASGGIDYYSKESHEWYDTVMAIYEYENRQRTRASILPDSDHQRQPGLFRELHGRSGHPGALGIRGGLSRIDLPPAGSPAVG